MDNNIYKRRSYRKFSDKQIEPEKIEQILKSGMQAPSACDQRPWHFLVITQKQLLTELSKATPYSMCIKNSNCAIVPYYNTEKLKNQDYVICDMSACTENILLEVTNQNLGAVWIGIAPNQERITNLQKILKLEKNLIPFCIIPIGYPITLKDKENRYDKTRIKFIK